MLQVNDKTNLYWSFISEFFLFPGFLRVQDSRGFPHRRRQLSQPQRGHVRLQQKRGPGHPARPSASHRPAALDILRSDRTEPEQTLLQQPAAQHLHPQRPDDLQTRRRLAQPVGRQLRRGLGLLHGAQRLSQVTVLRSSLPPQRSGLPLSAAAAAHHLAPQRPADARRRSDRPGPQEQSVVRRRLAGPQRRLQRADPVAGGSGGAAVVLGRRVGAGQDQLSARLCLL